MRMKTTLKAVLLGGVILVCCQNVSAQYYKQKENPNRNWNVLLEPYFMLPYLHGTVGLQPLPSAEVRERPRDVLRHLKMQGMFSGEVYNKDWSISTDFMYVKLGQEVEHQNGIVSGDVSLRQINWEVAGMYRFLPWLEAGAALQLNHLKSGLDLNVNTLQGPIPMAKEGSKTWVDPSLVGRAYYAFSGSKKWFVQCRANVGGFGIGSNFYWQAHPYVGYHFSRLFQLSAGYRLIGMNYRHGAEGQRFVYDMLTHGPVLRIGFNL